MKEGHFLVSGCHATLMAASVRRPDVSLTVSWLLIKPDDKKLVFQFVGSERSSSASGVSDEMMKIKDSIRIVKRR